MNKKIYYLFIAFLIFLILILFNKNKIVDTINASHKSGFYVKPFELTLSSDKDNLIRYTFDSSIPTNQSRVFKNKLVISGFENYDSLSYVNTTIADSIANYGWRPPIEKQDRATVLKYAAFQDGECISDIKTSTFFIDSSLENDLMISRFISRIISPKEPIITKYNLPIISISTNKDNLYSNKKGLFVAGDKSNPNIKTSDRARRNIKHSGNYFERGKDFEREVFLQYFTSIGKLSFELNIGMRIHGGITRRNPQKSLKFYAREEYGIKQISFPFMANKGINRFILESMQESGGGQALIEDVVAQDIVKDLDLEKQQFQAVIVFINGEYWGIHNIRDRLDENFLSYRFNLHKDSFDIIDGNPTRGYEVIHGSNSDYLEMLDFVKENNLSDDKNYDLLSNKLDITNLIDYYSVEIFFANHDWPIHNIKMYRKKGGKWRFILYDLDGGFTTIPKNANPSSIDAGRDHTFNMFERLFNKEDTNPKASFLFRNLMTNKKFRNKFDSRYKEIIQTYMQPERTLPIVDSIASIYRTNMQSHINRWRYPWSKKNHWERDIEVNVKDFLRSREKSTLENLNSIMNYNNLEKTNIVD